MKKFVLFFTLGVLCFSVFSQVHALTSEDDNFLLLIVPSMVGSFRCEEGEFETCRTKVGCKKINGFWYQGICIGESESRSNTELLFGKWYLVSSFSNGDFFNYIEFEGRTLKPISGSQDFSVNGNSHSTSDFADLDPNDAIGSYDSSNSDWFILDYWGRDLGTISSIEINRISDTLFTGCEFFLNYPDLTYLDGFCNPVRMTKNGLFKHAETPVVTDRFLQVFKRNGSGRAPSRTPGAEFRPQASKLAE